MLEKGTTVQIAAPYFPSWHGQSGEIVRTVLVGAVRHFEYAVALPDGDHYFRAEELKQPPSRLPLGTIVQLRGGVGGVVCNRSTYSSSRYEITWFDRHYFQVRRKWLDRAVFIVIGAQNQTAQA